MPKWTKIRPFLFIPHTCVAHENLQISKSRVVVQDSANAFSAADAYGVQPFTGLFLHSLKISGNFCFSVVFGKYKKISMTWNRFMIIKISLIYYSLALQTFLKHVLSTLCSFTIWDILWKRRGNRKRRKWYWDREKRRLCTLVLVVEENIMQSLSVFYFLVIKKIAYRSSLDLLLTIFHLGGTKDLPGGRIAWCYCRIGGNYDILFDIPKSN